MIIWLRQHAAEPLAGSERLGVGVAGEIVRREALAQLVELDQGYLALQQQHRDVLAVAHDEAAALVAQAATKAQALRDAAQREFDSGHERGFEAGRRAALADWYRHTAQSLAQRHDMQRSLAPRVAELVVAAVEKIVAVEEPAALLARAAQAVDRIVDGGSYLRVSVHPDQQRAAEREFGRVVEHWRELGRAVPLTVSADRALAPGDCLCETDIGSIDASLAVQLDAIRAAVTGAAQRVDAAVEAPLLPDELVAHTVASPHAGKPADTAQPAGDDGTGDDGSHDPSDQTKANPNCDPNAHVSHDALKSSDAYSGANHTFDTELGETV
jgi:type III secretion protein L